MSSPYKQLYDEVDMKVSYTLTKEEVIDAIENWLEVEKKETNFPENIELEIVYHDAGFFSTFEGLKISGKR